MKWTIRLPYQTPPLSLNRRLHWAREAATKQQLKFASYALARNERIPKLDKAIVTLHWVPKDNRRRDTDNPAPTLKSLIDGLVKAEVVVDDSSQYVQSSVVIDPPSKSDPHLYLTIEEN